MTDHEIEMWAETYLKLRDHLSVVPSGSDAQWGMPGVFYVKYNVPNEVTRSKMVWGGGRSARRKQPTFENFLQAYGVLQ